MSGDLYPCINDRCEYSNVYLIPNVTEDDLIEFSSIFEYVDPSQVYFRDKNVLAQNYRYSELQIKFIRKFILAKFYENMNKKPENDE